MPYEVMRVREMIDAAFGDKDASCPVDFNLIGSVIYIIARRLKLTKRTFKVQIQPFSRNRIPQETFQLDEIKIHTTVEKKVRKAKKMPTNGQTLEIHNLVLDKKKRGKRQVSARRRSVKSPGRKKQAHDFIDSGTITGDKYSTAERSTKKTKCDRLARDTFLQDGTAGVHQTSEPSDGESQSERRKYSVDISTGERRRAEKYNEMFTSYSPIMHISSKSSIGEKSRSDKYAKDAKAKGPAAKKRVGQKGLQIDATGSFKESESIESTSDDDDETFVVTKEIHEKLYIVTRTPSRRQVGNVDPKLSPVVTQAQFVGLLAKIQILQKKYGVTPKWNCLDQPISITDPRAAMNISMRLDTAQDKLDTLLNIVTEIASQTPGIDKKMLLSDTRDTKKYSKVELTEAPDNKIVHTQTAYSKVLKSSRSVLGDEEGTNSQTWSTQTENVKHDRLRIELEKVRKKVQNTVNDEIADSKLEKCGKSLLLHEIRVNKILDKFKELENLSRAVDKMGKKMRAVDEYMTVKLGYFQESLIQMHGDLDVAVDAFNESLSNPKEDPAAVKHMNQRFSAYKKDLVHIGLDQINLKDDIKQSLHQVHKAAEDIKKRITQQKCTRAEMYAALRNKLTVEDINGFLHVMQYGAVTEENRTQLKTIYNKIFGMERDWQKAIEEFHCKLTGSPTRAQVASLDASVQQVLNKFNSELNAMFAIVGPIKKYPTHKKLIQERNCLCCGTKPEADEDKINLKIWPEMEPTTDKAVSKSTEMTDQRHGELCLPGHPIPHPLEQNSYICQHDCGELKYSADKLFPLHIKNLNRKYQGISDATTCEQPVQVEEY